MTANLVVAQQPSDYFAVNRDAGSLRVVEQYHLSPETFWAAYNAGGYQDALKQLDFVLRYFPNHPKALLLLNSVARLLKDPNKAYPYYQKALRLYPQYAITHAQCGELLASFGEIDAGISELKEALARDSKLAVAHAWLASAYYRQGKPDLAQQSETEARKLGYVGDIEGKPAAQPSKKF